MVFTCNWPLYTLQCREHCHHHGVIGCWEGIIQPSLKSYWKWRGTLDVTGGWPLTGPWWQRTRYQLVFGQNPILPSVLTNKPPARESSHMSTWIAEHFITLHAARRAFTEAECCESFQRALRKQLRPIDDRYETGDKVYFKRVDRTERSSSDLWKRWCGDICEALMHLCSGTSLQALKSR